MMSPRHAATPASVISLSLVLSSVFTTAPLGSTWKEMVILPSIPACGFRPSSEQRPARASFGWMAAMMSCTQRPGSQRPRQGSPPEPEEEPAGVVVVAAVVAAGRDVVEAGGRAVPVLVALVSVAVVVVGGSEDAEADAL